MTSSTHQLSTQPLQSRIEIEKNELVRIIGPARISVVEGRVRILGLDLRKSESVVISRYRSYCLKAVENTILVVVLGEGGSIEKPSPGEEVIDLWESAAKSIVEKGGITVIFGSIESGKTSFSTLVSNLALDMGKKPCIVDADVGQGDLAPPTFIGVKCFDRKVLWLREEKGEYMKFVGSLTPSYPMAMVKIVTGVLDLVFRARVLKGDPIIVNTDGWFGDTTSIEYKHVLAKVLSPTSIVILGQEYCSAFKTMLRTEAIDIYCLPKPKVVKERNREERKDLRKINYQKWFNNMKRICLHFDDISISGLCSLSGMPIPNEEIAELEKTLLNTRILHAVRYSDLDIVVVPDDAIIPREVLERLSRKIFVVRPSNAKGLIAAITDKKLSEVGIAVVDEIDFNSRKLCVLTEYSGEIGGLIIGKVKLDEQWNDAVRHPKCLI